MRTITFLSGITLCLGSLTVTSCTIEEDSIFEETEVVEGKTDNISEKLSTNGGIEDVLEPEDD